MANKAKLKTSLQRHEEIGYQKALADVRQLVLKRYEQQVSNRPIGNDYYTVLSQTWTSIGNDIMAMMRGESPAQFGAYTWDVPDPNPPIQCLSLVCDSPADVKWVGDSEVGHRFQCDNCHDTSTFEFGTVDKSLLTGKPVNVEP